MDYRCFGEIMSKARAPERCPHIHFEMPIVRPVTAVLWQAHLENGTSVICDVPCLWAGPGPERALELIELDDKPEGVGLFAPKLAIVSENPPREMVLRLESATKFWRPFTSLVAAGKLLPVLLDMSPPERKGFFGADRPKSESTELASQTSERFHPRLLGEMGEG